MTPTSTPPPATIAVSLGIDVLVVGVVGLTALVYTTPVIALVVVLGIGGSLASWRGVFGGSIGHSILRLRSIDALSGLPSFRFRRPRQIVRRGTGDDPYALVPRSVPSSLPESGVSLHGEARSHLRLVVDDGTTHTVQHAALIGRDPTVPLDARHTLVAIPDLTRTIAKSHVLIEVSRSGLTVTDLGTTAGTRIENGPALAPHVPTPVSWGASVLLGERRIMLEQRRRTAEVS